MIVQSGLYIIQHRQILKQTDILKGSGNTGFIDIYGFLPCNILSVQDDTSVVRLVYTGQQIEYRGFTGSVRSDQAIKLPLLNTDMKCIYRPESAKGNA